MSTMHLPVYMVKLRPLLHHPPLKLPHPNPAHLMMSHCHPKTLRPLQPVLPHLHNLPSLLMMSQTLRYLSDHSQSAFVHHQNLPRSLHLPNVYETLAVMQSWSLEQLWITLVNILRTVLFTLLPPAQHSQLSHQALFDAHRLVRLVKSRKQIGWTQSRWYTPPFPTEFVNIGPTLPEQFYLAIDQFCPSPHH